MKVYYYMDQGDHIDNHLELIRFHDDFNIYISRRGLKHFVESRKKEMENSHIHGDIIDKLNFAIDNLMATFMEPDILEVEKTARLIFVKHFTDLRGSSLRVVLEQISDRLEICSIHFQKYKKPP